MSRIASLFTFAFLAAGCTQQAQSAQEATTTQTAALGNADADGGKRGPHGHHKPPQEAFDACAAKATGDTCTVSFDGKSIDGTCITPPAGADETAAFCAPPHGPGGHGGPGGKGPHGPPPAEVFTACDGKTEGSTCAVTFGDHTMDGTCKTPPKEFGETRLGCAPAHPGPPPGN